MHLLIWNGDAMNTILDQHLILVSEMNKTTQQRLIDTCIRIQKQLSELSKEYTTKEDKENEKDN
jgi:hypothetical protein